MFAGKIAGQICHCVPYTTSMVPSMAWIGFISSQFVGGSVRYDGRRNTTARTTNTGNGTTNPR